MMTCAHQPVWTSSHVACSECGEVLEELIFDPTQVEDAIPANPNPRYHLSRQGHHLAHLLWWERSFKFSNLARRRDVLSRKFPHLQQEIAEFCYGTEYKPSRGKGMYAQFAKFLRDKGYRVFLSSRYKDKIVANTSLPATVLIKNAAGTIDFDVEKALQVATRLQGRGMRQKRIAAFAVFAALKERKKGDIDVISKHFHVSRDFTNAYRTLSRAGTQKRRGT